MYDGQVFSVEGATVTATYTPGHSHDHMCFILSEDEALFTGDNVLGHGVSVAEDLGAYMRSLQIMQAQRRRIGYPAHGAVIPNLPGTILDYITQRERREKRILRSLSWIKENEKTNGKKGKGSVSLKELVVTIYGEDGEDELNESVLQPVTNQVLQKLAEDRRVGYEMNVDEKMWFLIEA